MFTLWACWCWCEFSETKYKRDKNLTYKPFKRSKKLRYFPSTETYNFICVKCGSDCYNGSKYLLRSITKFDLDEEEFRQNPTCFTCNCKEKFADIKIPIEHIEEMIKAMHVTSNHLYWDKSAVLQYKVGNKHLSLEITPENTTGQVYDNDISITYARGKYYGKRMSKEDFERHKNRIVENLKCLGVQII
jgi:hypothetical protein